MSYRKILAAIDLNEQHDHIIEKALALGGPGNVTVVSVMEAWNMLLAAGGVDAGAEANVVADLQTRLHKKDEEKMQKIRQKYQLPDQSTELLEGKPVHEIKRYAQDNGFDLIVTGTHGRHGLKLILGSVSSGILHGTPCDVLAVKV